MELPEASMGGLMDELGSCEAGWFGSHGGTEHTEGLWGRIMGAWIFIVVRRLLGVLILRGKFGFRSINLRVLRASVRDYCRSGDGVFSPHS